MPTQYERVQSSKETRALGLIINKTEQFPLNSLPCSNKFIKLYGSPQENHIPHPTNPTSPTGNVEALFLVDILDANNEDPFSLEPLDKLIKLHAERGKDFIIARVTTADPHDESLLYFSYYAAHHINKVLFRTQPSEGLLHRMKAKNPLNNMTIVGDVHYYIVSAPQIPSRSSSKTSSPTYRELSLSSPSFSPKYKILDLVSRITKSHPKKTLHLVPKPEAYESSENTLLLKQLKRRSSLQEQGIQKANISPTLSERSKSPTQDSFSNQHELSNIQDWINSRTLLDAPKKRASPVKKRGKSDIEVLSSPTSPVSPTIYHIASYYGTDDDFLMKSSVRAYFKEMALEDGDALLFTLPTDDQIDTALLPHPTLANFMYSVQEEDLSGQQRSMRLLVCCYIAFGVIFVKFLVPEQHIYIVSFILVFALCLGLLLYY